jgi:putative SOS response-associated peptidase YedK
MTAIVRLREGERVLTGARWDLKPFHWKAAPGVKRGPLFNVRAETVKQKCGPQLSAKRCLVPARGFHEWRLEENGKKVKYRFELPGGQLYSFAGLWDGEEPSCAIITTTPNEIVEPFHNRMPVILLPEQESAWLDCNEAEVHEVLTYLKPYAGNLLVSPA